MFKNLPPYIKLNTKEAEAYRTELLFSIWANNQVLLNRIAKLEASLTKKSLEAVKADIDTEAERIAEAGLKEIEAFYGE